MQYNKLNLSVEMIIIGIHFTKNNIKIVKNLIFFILCPNQMNQTSIYRPKKIMNFGKNKNLKKLIYNKIIEFKLLR